MVAEKFSADASGFCCSEHNPSGFGPNMLIGGNTLDVDYGWGQSQIPDGTRVGVGYDHDINGAVSAHHTDLANFLFADGHAKALRPVATDPDPVNQPQNNLWDATRS
jgi:prepilin-type processing-associated H-X9-DG protein